MTGSAIPLRRRARSVARRVGLDIHSYQAARDIDVRRTQFLRTHCVSAVVDAGANTGQWALATRRHGFPGLIVSFEPLADAYSALCHAADGDSLWRCVQAAVGDAKSEMPLNVAGNSVSSSLLPMEPAHASAAPMSAYVRTETVRVVRLDEIIPKMVPATTVLALKLDLQGYERAALAGAEGILAEVQVVECELSTVPLYRGQPLYLEMIELLGGLGFCLASLDEGLMDPATGHVMQIDAIFTRMDDLRAHPRRPSA